MGLDGEGVLPFDVAPPVQGEVWRPAIGERVEVVDRSARVSTAGFEPVTFSWPQRHVIELNRVVAAYRAPYRQWHVRRDRSGNYSLVMSSLVAHAVRRALPNVEEWVHLVPTDRRSVQGRRLPAVREPVRQVTMTWPTDLRVQVDDVFSDLQGRQWPAGFRLAKKSFVLTAVLSQVPSVGEWFFEVPNDSRLVRPARRSAG